jgi:signal peptidase II
MISLSKKKILMSAGIVLCVIFFDRLSKIFFSSLLSHGESFPVFRNIFHFTLVHNTGIAFGFFKNYNSFFIIVSFIAVLFFTSYLFFNRNSSDMRTAELVAFSLIIAGALGNLIDRLILGYVIDFIDFRFWPVFNIADSAITIGTTILLIKCIPFFAK